jgi:hypothetical protein
VLVARAGRLHLEHRVAELRARIRLGASLRRPRLAAAAAVAGMAVLAVLLAALEDLEVAVAR